MECLDTTSSLKINYKKNIGNVLLIVEGSESEIELFKHIFYKILGYKYIEKKRTRKKFKEYDKFVRPDNENSQVIVINAKNSNISTFGIGIMIQIQKRKLSTF